MKVLSVCEDDVSGYAVEAWEPAMQTTLWIGSFFVLHLLSSPYLLERHGQLVIR